MSSRRPPPPNEPRIVTRYPVSPYLVPMDTRDLSLAPRQHLSPSTASARSRSGSPFSTHSVSSQSSNRSTQSATTEHGNHEKSRYLKFSHNGKTEVHRFDTIKQKLDWIETNRSKYPALQRIDIYHHYDEPTPSSTATEVSGAGTGVSSSPANNSRWPSTPNGSTIYHINNYHNDTHLTDARVYSPRVSIDGLDAPNLNRVDFNGRQDGPAALPVSPLRRPLLPNNSGGAALPWHSKNQTRQPNLAGQRR